MALKLFVGNLPWSTTDTDLVQLLGENGVVCEKVDVVTDRTTGKSRGFAFATFATEEDSALATDVLRTTTIGGRELVVSEAHSDGGQRRSRRGGPPERRGGGGRDFRREDRSRRLSEGHDFPDSPWRSR